ncbi:MAG: acyl-CoA dehydrogenase family protein [Polyangiales bacterium]
MDFALSDLHRQVQEMARDFATREVAPHAARWDEEERFPQEIVPRLAELGFLGIRLDPAYGGAGLDTLCYALVVEALAAVDGSLALTVASHNGLASTHIATFASDALKERYLPRLARGEILGAWALTEPDSGSDAAGLRTRAQRHGATWRISGSKTFITQGSVGGVCVVLASTAPERRQHGITAFALEPSMPGYQASRHIRKLGCRSSDTVELSFSDVAVDDGQRIGAVDHGFIDALQILERGRISIAAMALGLGEGALKAACEYARQRQQFGRPIAKFQAIQWLLADSRTELDAARLLTYRAAWAADQQRGPALRCQAAQAKLFASEAATRVCNRALQVLGGYGYSRDFPVERALRDAKLCEIGEGTSQVQRLLIARHLLARTQG